jgi:hypothetical protein
MGQRDRAQQHSDVDVRATIASEVPSAVPSAASSARRAAVAWWVVFFGPAIIVSALAVAGSVGGEATAVWVFVLGVWAFTLTLGLAAAPRTANGLWWVLPLLASFLAAAAALVLLLGVSRVGDSVGP